MKKKNLAIGSGLLAAGLAAGSIFAPLGLAGAQDDLPESNDGTDTEADTPTNDHRRGLRSGRGEAVAEVLGLTTDEVRAALQEGSTLAEIAATQGISEADLVSQLVAQAQTHLDELVASGDITAEEAAEKSAGLQDRVTNAVNADPAERRAHRGHRGHKGHGQALETLGEILGLTTDEIKEGFAAGQSIADMATVQGVDVDSVVDQLVAEAMERVDAAVEAGKIDAERAAEITEGLEEKMSERVNADPSERPERGERRGQRGPQGADDEAEATETGLDA